MSTHSRFFTLLVLLGLLFGATFLFDGVPQAGAAPTSPPAGSVPFYCEGASFSSGTYNPDCYLTDGTQISGPATNVPAGNYLFLTDVLLHSESSTSAVNEFQIGKDLANGFLVDPPSFVMGAVSPGTQEVHMQAPLVIEGGAKLVYRNLDDAAYSIYAFGFYGSTESYPTAVTTFMAAAGDAAPTLRLGLLLVMGALLLYSYRVVRREPDPRA